MKKQNKKRIKRMMRLFGHIATVGLVVLLTCGFIGYELYALDQEERGFQEDKASSIYAKLDEDLASLYMSILNENHAGFMEAIEGAESKLRELGDLPYVVEKDGAKMAQVHEYLDIARDNAEVLREIVALKEYNVEVIKYIDENYADNKSVDKNKLAALSAKLLEYKNGLSAINTDRLGEISDNIALALEKASVASTNIANCINKCTASKITSYATGFQKDITALSGTLNAQNTALLKEKFQIEKLEAVLELLGA